MVLHVNFTGWGRSPLKQIASRCGAAQNFQHGCGALPASSQLLGSRTLIRLFVDPALMTAAPATSRDLVNATFEERYSESVEVMD